MLLQILSPSSILFVVQVMVLTVILCGVVFVCYHLCGRRCRSKKEKADPKSEELPSITQEPAPMPLSESA